MATSQPVSTPQSSTLVSGHLCKSDATSNSCRRDLPLLLARRNRSRSRGTAPHAHALLCKHAQTVVFPACTCSSGQHLTQPKPTNVMCALRRTFALDVPNHLSQVPVVHSYPWPLMPVASLSLKQGCGSGTYSLLLLLFCRFAACCSLVAVALQ